MSRVIYRTRYNHPIHLPPIRRTPRGLLRSWTHQPQPAPPRSWLDLLLEDVCRWVAVFLFGLVAALIVAAAGGLL